MPTKSHHRSRSSVDQVLGLLADLPEHQIALLLDDFNHTTASNVPVSAAITIFDPSTPKPKRSFGRASSPVRNLEAELVRRHSKRLSKRISSAPEPIHRPRPPSQLSFTQNPPRLSITITSDDIILDNEPEPQQERSPRPSLTLTTIPNPSFFERPKTADNARGFFRLRAYKRISRPMILSPTATAELHQLLLAYIYDTPASASSTASSSPVTPNDSTSPFSAFAPIRPEIAAPVLDLLEPSPARAPTPLIFGKGGMNPCSMSGIFEVLASH
jgi:hypothetical protein